MKRLKPVVSAPTYRYIQATIFVVLVIAFVTSFRSGSKGATSLGYPEHFDPAFPLVCDIVAALATFIHGRVRTDQQMRRTAAAFVLVTMGLSWVANAINHSQAAWSRPEWSHYPQWAPWQQYMWLALVILGAGLCPVAVTALLYLATKYVEFEQRQAPAPSHSETPAQPDPAATAAGPVETASPAETPPPRLTPVPVSTGAAEEPSPYDLALAWIREHPGQGWRKAEQTRPLFSRATFHRALKDPSLNQGNANAVPA